MEPETNEPQRLEIQKQLREELNRLQEPDFRLENPGSIVLLQPLSTAANDWVSENLSGAMTWAGAVVIEPRYVDDIVAGIENDGLTFAL